MKPPFPIVGFFIFSSLNTLTALFSPPHLCLCPSAYLASPFLPAHWCCSPLKAYPASFSLGSEGWTLVRFRQQGIEPPVGALVASSRSLTLICFTYWAFLLISFEECIPELQILFICLESICYFIVFIIIPNLHAWILQLHLKS